MRRTFDILFFALGIAILALFTTRYRMPFRLDDVLLMLWAQGHSLVDAFDPVKGQMVNSFRPLFALTAYVLTKFAGWDHPFWWHLTLDLSLLIGITFTGLTVRFLIHRWESFQISVLLYFLAFLPILNIFFWYSDLTYGLEICFTALCWYFSLRGMHETRTGLWLTGMAMGTLAVLSKEPAFVLVHLVIAGSFLLERNRIITQWKKSGRKVALPLIGYLFLLIVTLWVAFLSPTKTNRFFPLHTPELGFFIRDRISYYSETYLSIPARALLFFPIVFAFLRTIYRKAFEQFSYLSVAAFVLALLLFQNVLIAVPLMIFIFVTIGTLPNSERERVRRLFPFLACLTIAMVALLFTIQLVKTQLTEAALLTSILSAWAWTVWISDLKQAIVPYRKSNLFRWGIGIAGIAVAILFFMGILPKAAKEEHLLTEVRDVRQNANEAVEWAARNLPAGALLAVTDYQLYGIDGPYAITGKDNETKLADQYTFAGGFVFDALKALGRSDFQRTFLTDSLLLPRVIDAMRTEPNSYILLQSKLDIDLFHGTRNSSLLLPSDSICVRFSRGPYPCEIWKLQ
ncbi:MAG TPA: hypothetical protein VGM92_04395 [Candidatus Kapabacteria bacterium]